MSAMDYAFRSAAIGGFNRQDVLDYMETTGRKQEEKLALLQRETDEAKRARQAAEEAIEALRAAEEEEKGMTQDREGNFTREIEDLRAAVTEQSSRLESAERKLTETEGELERTAQSLVSVRGELEDLKARSAKMEAGARAYEELKDRTATIELEAHQRARSIEKEAEERVRRFRAAAERLLERIQSGYERLRGDVDATINHASGELGRVDKALESVKAEFAEHDAELEALLRTYQESGELTCDSVREV